jgi:hypothetical protein
MIPAAFEAQLTYVEEITATSAIVLVKRPMAPVVDSILMLFKRKQRSFLGSRMMETE